MELVVALVLGVLIGVLTTLLLGRPKTRGVLRVNASDETENPYLYVELSEDVNRLIQRKYVKFRIDVSRR